MSNRERVKHIISKYCYKKDSLLPDWNYVLKVYANSGYIHEPDLDLGVYFVGYYVYEEFDGEYNFFIRYLNGNKYKLDLYFPFFGFSLFDGYKNDPIVLVEGITDLFYLRNYYPYVLSVMGSSVSYEQVFYLKSLTKRVILAFDSDYAGRRGVDLSYIRLSKFGFDVFYIFPEYDDWGDYIKNGCMFSEVLQDKLNSVIYGNVDK